MKHAEHSAEVKRLRRVEGQVRGIIRMVEEERYCVDILTQLRAAQVALRKVAEQVLRSHVEHCVVQAVAEGGDEQQQKIDELLEVVGRFHA